MATVKTKYHFNSETVRKEFIAETVTVARDWIDVYSRTDLEDAPNAFAVSLNKSLIKSGGMLSLKQWGAAIKCAYDDAFAEVMHESALESAKKRSARYANKQDVTPATIDDVIKANVDRTPIKNDRMLKPNANQTDHLRAIVKDHIFYEAFVAAHDVKRATLKGKQLFDACDYLGIDMAQIIKEYNDAKKAQFAAIGQPVAGAVDWERVREIARSEVERRTQPIYKTKLVLDQGGVKKNIDIKGVKHPKFDILFTLMNTMDYNQYLNVILCGPTGTGKSFAARQIADALGLKFYLQVAALENYDLIGYEKIDGTLKETPFLWAFKFGGVILLDELDSYDPKALTALNSALANAELLAPDGTIIPRHKDCRVIGATNTSGFGATGDYHAREALDLATLSRFTAQIDWHCDPALELLLATKHGGQEGADWATECDKARAAFKRLDLPALVDQRTIEAGIGMLKQGLELPVIRELTYLSRLDSDQQIAIKELVGV